jgi:hypothetical protein
VLFLDDLQWAEPASLTLIERLLANAELGHLLIIGAYRDHDAEQIHLLLRTLESIAEAGGTISKISLLPLDPSDVNQLIADTLHTTRHEVTALGEEIYKKTHGNPFFVGQLLTSLSRDDSSFGERAGVRWDLPRSPGATVTGNVADFMRRGQAPSGVCSPHEARRLSGTSQFDHGTLARSQRSPRPACAALWTPSWRASLPQHEDYRLLSDLEVQGARGRAAVASRVTSARPPIASGAACCCSKKRGRASSDNRAPARAARGEIPDDSVFSIVDHLTSATRSSGPRRPRGRGTARAGRRAG